ncbi:MAG: MBL fold metallo-hydrolase [Holophagales bacterium]|jgi:glyoxylase-like metal-dependent hydrolase (beta-lactamase superfamily II)|nr:MBL fold metallo-hydrolase [Holophagales bacterium]
MFSLLLPALLAMQTQAVQPSAPQHRAENVRDNIYCVYGPGGNVGLIVGDDHLVMIDGQFEQSLPGLLEAVKTISDKPIKYLINTHHHGDHVGANRALAPMVQGIIAHVNVRTRLAKEQEDAAAEKKGGLPNLLIGEADPKKPGMMTMAIGDSMAHLAHFGPGHTDNDIAIGIPGARVIHVGDILFLERLPYIDTESGGSFDGLVQVIGHILSWLPEDSLVIPGHGPVCDKKEFERHHSFLLAVQKHFRDNPAMTPSELADSFDKAPWEDKKPSSQFVTWETLFRAAAGKGPGRVK